MRSARALFTAGTTLWMFLHPSVDGSAGPGCHEWYRAVEAIGPGGTDRTLYTGLAELPRVTVDLPADPRAIFRHVVDHPGLAALGVPEPSRQRLARFLRNVAEGVRSQSNNLERSPALLFSTTDREAGNWLSASLVNPRGITANIEAFYEGLAWTPRANDRFLDFVKDNRLPVLDVSQTYVLNRTDTPLARFEGTHIESERFGVRYYYRELRALAECGDRRVVLSVPVTRDGGTHWVSTLWWIPP